MSRPPTRRRPSRIRRWRALVDDVQGPHFGASIVPVDHHGPELYANFPTSAVPGVQPGDVVNIYVYQRGKKFRTVLRIKDLGVWTAEELEQICAGARAMAAELRRHVEGSDHRGT